MTVAIMADSLPSDPSTTSALETKSADERRHRRRLSRIRRAVLRGDYENALKLSVAADRLLERLVIDEASRRH